MIFKSDFSVPTFFKDSRKYLSFKSFDMRASALRWGPDDSIGASSRKNMYADSPSSESKLMPFFEMPNAPTSSFTFSY